MKYSREQLTNIAQDTGFRAEILEKVLLLMDLLVGFLDALLNFGEIKPELLTDNLDFQEKVKLHPAIHWTAYNVKKQKES